MWPAAGWVGGRMDTPAEASAATREAREGARPDGGAARATQKLPDDVPAASSGKRGATKTVPTIGLTRGQMVALGALAAVALLAVGFLGYPDAPGGPTPGWLRWLDARLAEPWPIYAAWAAAVYALQREMLRPRGLATWRQRLEASAVTAGLAVVVFVLRYWGWGEQLGRFILRILSRFRIENSIFVHLAGNPWAYTGVEIVLVGGALALAVWRLRRLAAMERRNLTWEKLLAASLIPVAGICFALSWVLRFDTLGPLLHGHAPYIPLDLRALPPQPLGTHNVPPITPCSVALPGTCPPSSTAVTFSFVDLVAGAVLLALAALLAGIALMQVVARNRRALPLGAPWPRIWRAQAKELLDILLWAVRPLGPYGPLRRLARATWWLALLGALICGAQMAQAVQDALHAPPDLDYLLGALLDRFVHLELPVFAWALAALLFTLAAVWMLTTTGAAVRLSSLMAVDLVGALLPVLGLYSLGLWLMNRAALLAAWRFGWQGTVLPDARLHPFELGLVALLSLLVLLVGALALVAHRGAAAGAWAGERLGASWWGRRFLAWWNKPLKPKK